MKDEVHAINGLHNMWENGCESWEY